MNLIVCELQGGPIPAFFRARPHSLARINMQGDKSGDAHAPIHFQLKSEVVEKKDVFDSESFDAVQFINKIYPDGESD